MIEHSDEPLVFNTKANNAKYDDMPKQALNCPFCDHTQLAEIYRTDGPRLWVKNKFSTIDASLMTVIIESDKHLGDVSTYSLAENRKVFRFAFDCWREMLTSGNYRSVLMFKNFGPRSGGTLRHPHMQIIGLEDVDGYAEISSENFEGVKVVEHAALDVTLSTRPIMGFVEFNVILSALTELDSLADSVHLITQYLLTDYVGGRCDSYNLFFYHYEEKFICKIVPRFITSPYFIGYKIPEVNRMETLEDIAKELRVSLSALIEARGD